MNLKKYFKGFDGSAAIWAGLIAGVIFLLVELLLNNAVLGSSDIVWRMIAGIVRGESALNSATPLDGGMIAIALLVHLILSIIFGTVIATIIHRWGLLVGFFGGAMLGFFFYGINFFSVSFFFPWFYPLRSWIWLVGHLIFGATAGTVYELIEIDEDEMAEAGAGA